MNNKKNKTAALVTGASNGIGREIAEVLLRKGFNLFLVARSLEKLEQIQADFKKIADEQVVTVFQADLSKDDAPKLVFDYTVEKNIAIDILVNNAGVGISGAIDEYSEQATLNMILLNMYSLTAFVSIFHLK